MITNDEAMDTICDAMTFIDTTEVPYPKEASNLILRLRQLIKWVEVQVDGDWDSNERMHEEDEDEEELSPCCGATLIWGDLCSDCKEHT